MVFYFLFFSLGILPIWAAIDVRYMNSPFLNWWFGGIYTELVADMFADVVGFMFEVYRIQMCFPIIEFSIQAIVRMVGRCIDQKKCYPNDLKETSSPTMTLLFDKYMGPPFFIHYKYSYILMYTFVAFAWGALVPAMFIMSLTALIIMHVVERMMIYYSYVHPPTLDNEMTELAIQILYKAPFLLCFSGAWAFSNRAIYHNEIKELDPKMVYPEPYHYFS